MILIYVIILKFGPLFRLNQNKYFLLKEKMYKLLCRPLHDICYFSTLSLSCMRNAVYIEAWKLK